MMERKWQSVKVPPHFGYNCFACHGRFSTETSPATADLNGPPFEAYYCPACAERLSANAPHADKDQQPV